MLKAKRRIIAGLEDRSGLALIIAAAGRRSLATENRKKPC
jgi:hypothetical protein